MTNDVLVKYADLLVNYCLRLKSGELLYIHSTFLAEPLIREVYKIACSRGVKVEINWQFREMNKIFMDYSSENLLTHVSTTEMDLMSTCDAYLVIRAPYNLMEDAEIPQDKRKIRSEALNQLNEIYFKRISDGSMKRCLCQYPTSAAAQMAGMSLEDYEKFVYRSCFLYDDNPAGKWIEISQFQQRIVDYLSKIDLMTFENENMKINFSVKNRTWINSDGKNNMPSGEVFTSPIEHSVNGIGYFDYPSIMWGREVAGIRLVVKDGKIIEWDAKIGKDILDKVFDIKGSRYFGEVAIATNYAIQRPTKNILFDEKIGGTVHMAVGQSYLQAGGKNKSAVHWDLIANMKKGKIYADNQLIFENGNFTI